MTIHTLHPYLDQDSGLYIYDDAPKGVFKEPLVHSTTQAIHCILLSAELWDDIKDKPERVVLNFSLDRSDFTNSVDPVIKLHYSRRDSDMSVYLVEGISPPAFVDECIFLDDIDGPRYVELCDHLMDYFPAAPEFFYCQLDLGPISHFGLVAA